MAAEKLLEALHNLQQWLAEENLLEGLQDVTLQFKDKGKQYAALFSLRRSMHAHSFVIKDPMSLGSAQEICGIVLRITGNGSEIQLYQQGIRPTKL